LHLAGLDDVVQDLHGLLDRHVVVEPVDVIDLDPVGVEPGQRRVQLPNSAA